MNRKARRFLAASVAVLKWLRPPPLDDILVLGGLLSVGAGLWFIYPPAAGVVLGAALVALGVLRSRA